MKHVLWIASLLAVLSAPALAADALMVASAGSPVGIPHGCIGTAAKTSHEDTPTATQTAAPPAGDPDTGGVQAEYLGNPLRERYPDREGLGFARTVWDLTAWRNRLYIASGNSGNSGPAANAGPVDVWYFDPHATRFVKEYAVDDEQIERYCVLPDGLYIPGHDAMESWDYGNIYANRGDGWTKLRTLPNAIHVYDIAEWHGQLVAVGHSLQELAAGAGYHGGGAFFISSDGGSTWECDLTVCTHYAGTEAFDPTRPDSVRFTELFEFNGELFASGWLMPTLYRLDNGRFEHVDVNMFPGLEDSLGTPCTELPETSAAFVESVSSDPQWIAAFQMHDPCMTARITRNVAFGNELVYVGAQMGEDHDWVSFGLYSAEGIQNGLVREISTPDESDQLRDLLVVGDRLYLLACQRSLQTPRSRIYSTKDLVHWSVLYEFCEDAEAYSFEHLGNWIYVGFGGGRSASGDIYRVPLDRLLESDE